MAKRKKNYLNNKDILSEIHKSKVSYCSYSDVLTDSQEDFIVDSTDEIFKTHNVQVKKDENGEPIFDDVPVILLAKEARATRLTKAGIPTNVEDVDETDIVFRVMNGDHVPLVPKKKPKSKMKKVSNVADIFTELLDDDDKSAFSPVIDEDEILVPMRTLFPPFLHYRLNSDGSLKLIGKSHWKGDFETGEFSMTHGAVTNTLALMYMKLCERYATRANWRGYCVDNETEALTQRGWLSGNEINEDDIILSYEDGNMKWSKIKSIFRDQFDGLMHKLDVRGMDALITPEHKLLTKRGLIKVEYLLESDKVILMGDAVKNKQKKKYSDSFVELIGWIVTEGTFQIKKRSVQIYQNEGLHAMRIRSCLNDLNYTFTEHSPKKCISFNIWKRSTDDIFNTIPNKNLNMEFILALTAKQRLLLINTMIAGDGWQRGKNRSYSQKDISHSKLFQALCAISGIKTNLHYNAAISYGKETYIHTINLFSKRGNSTRGSCINMHGGKQNGKVKGRGKGSHPNIPTTLYKGLVWCPETEYGCFLARRNGKVYLTGNSYNDEMRGQALLQLSQIGLQFNEAKSQNPFAYYTAVVTNSFTRVLNIEKKMQDIRDDILEENGLTPSSTRQFINANQNTDKYDFYKKAK